MENYYVARMVRLTWHLVINASVALDTIPNRELGCLLGSLPQFVILQSEETHSLCLVLLYLSRLTCAKSD